MVASADYSNHWWLGLLPLYPLIDADGDSRKQMMFCTGGGTQPGLAGMPTAHSTCQVVGLA